MRRPLVRRLCTGERVFEPPAKYFAARDELRLAQPRSHRITLWHFAGNGETVTVPSRMPARQEGEVRTM